MIVANGKLYEKCVYCGKLVRLNKPLFGSLHFCSTDEERAAKLYLDYVENPSNMPPCSGEFPKDVL